MENTFAQSLASHKTYVLAQIRKLDTELVNIQIAGAPANRPYGFAARAEAPADLVTWIDGQPKTLKSQASDEEYVACRLVNRGDTVHVQIKGEAPAGGEFARSYGAAFDLELPAMAQYVAAVLAANANAE